MSWLLGTAMSLDAVWLWIALIPPSVAFVRVVYGRTRPDATKAQSLVLQGLRTAAFALVLLLLAEPVLSMLARRALRPVLPVLIDTSPSMEVSDGQHGRLRQVRESLSEGLAEKLGPRARFWRFDRQARPIDVDSLPSLVASGYATDLGNALRRAAEEGISAPLFEGLLVISDGAHNLGEDPAAVAAEFEVPVHVLTVGSEEPPVDILLQSAEPVGQFFGGQSQQVQVQLRSWGIAGQSVAVRVLAEPDSLVATAHLTLNGDGGSQEVILPIPPLEPGPHILRVAVEEVPGELSTQNNQSLLFAQVHPRRLQVLIAAGGPGAEFTFLRRALEADSTLHVETRVHRHDGDWYGASFPGADELGELDVVILVDPPRSLLRGNEALRIAEFVQSGGGLLFIGGTRAFSDWRPAGPLAQILPLRSEVGSQVIAQPARLRLLPAAAQHPVTRSLTTQDAADPFTPLPPLLGRVSHVDAANTAAVLVGVAGRKEPVILSDTYGRGKVLVAIGAGFWRLDLLASGVGESPGTIHSVWNNGVRWLAVSADAGRLQATTHRRVYRAGEEVVIAAEVFDELMKPSTAEWLEVTLGEGQPRVMESVGAGSYRTSWSGLAPRDYRYRVTAHHQQGLLSESEGSFVVEEYSVEAADMRPRPALLRSLAQGTGGEFRPLSQWRELVKRIATPTQIVREERRLSAEVTQTAWMWFIVLLLGAEWLIRKRGGLL
ncbi:MAG: hypothetical protein VX733_03460 [Candidatus Latescibacterota bacterium]|nr:hypothetical protein [Candidatus Latescibacterota bacterium]